MTLAVRTFAAFAAIVHDLSPFGHRLDVRYERRVRTSPARAICGDHGRVVPTRQDLCPYCAGRVHDAAEIARIRSLAGRAAAVGVYDALAVDRLRDATRNPRKKRGHGRRKERTRKAVA